MKIKAYKAFKHDMTCKDFQYEEGKTYETTRASICSCGFHACLLPLDCLLYYTSDDDVFHEVELDGYKEYKEMFINADTKVAATKITIGKRISIPDMKKYEENLLSDKDEMDRFVRRFYIKDDSDKAYLISIIKTYIQHRGNPNLHLRFDYFLGRRYLADSKNHYIADIDGILQKPTPVDPLPYSSIKYCKQIICKQLLNF